jgi:sec-independent protein translocase protein TatB
MFGMGFSEILIILVIGVLFLGPDKLPEAMVKIAKFFNAFKKTINEARDSIDQELKIQDLKQEAIEYKKRLHETTDSIKSSMYIVELEEIKNSTTNISKTIKDNVEQAVSMTKNKEKKSLPKAKVKKIKEKTVKKEKISEKKDIDKEKEVKEEEKNV